MKYTMTVTERIENPDYDAQRKQYDDRRRYDGPIYDTGGPAPFIDTRTLQIDLDEEEYQAVRKAVLSEFGPKRDAR